MIENLDQTVYERNKDDPDWKLAYDSLQVSNLIFRIRNLIVHPGARIGADDVYGSERSVRMDLDTLELEAGYMLLPYYTYDITGGHLAFSLKDDITTLRCKSEKPVEMGTVVMHEGSTLIADNVRYKSMFINIGTNSTLDLDMCTYTFYGSRWDASYLKVGNNSYARLQLDASFPKSIEVGNNCKVLYKNSAGYIQTAAAPKKRIYCRRPNKIKDDTVCLLVV